MVDKKKRDSVHKFIIGTFVSLYIIVSLISTIHVVDFFKLSNPTWLAISLAVAFEIGAAASLAALIILEKTNKNLVWFLFITLAAFQMMGNTYYSFVYLHDFQGWVDLFWLSDYELIEQKRILAFISGAILPLVSLGFIKSLVDYIRPDVEDLVNEYDNEKYIKPKQKDDDILVVGDDSKKEEGISKKYIIPIDDDIDHTTSLKNLMDSYKEEIDINTDADVTVNKEQHLTGVDVDAIKDGKYSTGERLENDVVQYADKENKGRIYPEDEYIDSDVMLEKDSDINDRTAFQQNLHDAIMQPKDEGISDGISEVGEPKEDSTTDILDDIEKLTSEEDIVKDPALDIVDQDTENVRYLMENGKRTILPSGKINAVQKSIDNSKTIDEDDDKRRV